MQVGRNCTLNYNTGTYSTPVWTAMGRVSSPKINQARPTSRKVYREAPNSKNVTGVKDIGFSFTYVCKGKSATDAVLTALLASFNSETVMDVAALDGTATTGAKGIRGPFVVTQMNRNEDDEDAVSYDVTLSEVEDDVNANFNAASFTVP